MEAGTGFVETTRFLVHKTSTLKVTAAEATKVDGSVATIFTTYEPVFARVASVTVIEGSVF